MNSSMQFKFPAVWAIVIFFAFLVFSFSIMYLNLPVSLNIKQMKTHRRKHQHDPRDRQIGGQNKKIMSWSWKESPGKQLLLFLFPISRRTFPLNSYQTWVISRSHCSILIFLSFRIPIETHHQCGNLLQTCCCVDSSQSHHPSHCCSVVKATCRAFCSPRPPWNVPPNPSLLPVQQLISNSQHSDAPLMVGGKCRWTQ